MTTTPDYAGLIAEAEAAQEWMRQPDWADNFSLGDMVDWLRQRPTSILPKLTTALRTLLESNAALEARVKELEAELAALSAENERLRGALEWYGEQAGAIFSDEEEVNK